jgi:hypothetical protein
MSELTKDNGKRDKKRPLIQNESGASEFLGCWFNSQPGW